MVSRSSTRLLWRRSVLWESLWACLVTCSLSLGCETAAVDSTNVCESVWAMGNHCLPASYPTGGHGLKVMQCQSEVSLAPERISCLQNATTCEAFILCERTHRSESASHKSPSLSTEEKGQIQQCRVLVGWTKSCTNQIVTSLRLPNTVGECVGSLSSSLELREVLRCIQPFLGRSCDNLQHCSDSTAFAMGLTPIDTASAKTLHRVRRALAATSYSEALAHCRTLADRVREHKQATRLCGQAETALLSGLSAAVNAAVKQRDTDALLSACHTLESEAEKISRPTLAKSHQHCVKQSNTLVRQWATHVESLARSGQVEQSIKDCAALRDFVTRAKPSESKPVEPACDAAHKSYLHRRLAAATRAPAQPEQGGSIARVGKQGGEVKLQPGVSLVIPPGAVNEPTDFTVSTPRASTPRRAKTLERLYPPLRVTPQPQCGYGCVLRVEAPQSAGQATTPDAIHLFAPTATSRKTGLTSVTPDEVAGATALFYLKSVSLEPVQLFLKRSTTSSGKK